MNDVYLLEPPTVATMTPPKWAVLNTLAKLAPKHPTAREVVSASDLEMGTDTVYAVVNYFTHYDWVTQVHTAYPRRFHLTAHGAAGHRRLVSLNEWYLQVKPTWETLLPWIPRTPLQRNTLSCLIKTSKLDSRQLARQANIRATTAYDMLKRFHKGQWLICHTIDRKYGTAKQRLYSLRPELIEPTRQYLELFAKMTAPDGKEGAGQR